LQVRQEEIQLCCVGEAKYVRKQTNPKQKQQTTNLRLSTICSQELIFLSDFFVVFVVFAVFGIFGFH